MLVLLLETLVQHHSEKLLAREQEESLLLWSCPLFRLGNDDVALLYLFSGGDAC